MFYIFITSKPHLKLLTLNFLMKGRSYLYPFISNTKYICTSQPRRGAQQICVRAPTTGVNTDSLNDDIWNLQSKIFICGSNSQPYTREWRCFVCFMFYISLREKIFQPKEKWRITVYHWSPGEPHPKILSHYSSQSPFSESCHVERAGAVSENSPHTWEATRNDCLFRLLQRKIFHYVTQLS